MYRKGNYCTTYMEVPTLHPRHEWREGMVSGNGENGYITSGSPYADSFIFQHIGFNYPSPEPRAIPQELTGQLAEARENVFRQNADWTIKDATGAKRVRTFYYSYHPGHQLRFGIPAAGELRGYERWTNYETAETGVRYSDEHGEWVRTSFTSREDNASITRIGSSSTGAKINLLLSIDDISAMSGAYEGPSDLHGLQYKKMVDANCQAIVQVAHYPAYPGSELSCGGYAGVTRVVAVGGSTERVLLPDSREAINVGREPNVAIAIKDADAVYLITGLNRTFTMGASEDFAAMEQYALVDQLMESTNVVVAKYTRADGHFDYTAALASHVSRHAAEFNAVRFCLGGGESDRGADNQTLIAAQKAEPTRVHQAFMEQVYNQGRYALICCSGTSAPRLYGMWTGEWNPGWRGIYTLDANVNLQVASMNTGHLSWAPLGYISFFLRNTPDFAANARMAYGMEDAIQVSVNSDGDRAMHVEYDNDYPFEYWNAGASWCLLPIYEYWQCYGNRQIAIVEPMRMEALKGILSVRDGGLTDEEFARLIERGYLNLAEDILLPLLTKQANFWEQICTPEYYLDAEGQACYRQGKQALGPYEKYMILPAYSPENHPIGYSSTITANATMDISAARDGLAMVIALEQAVKREGYEAAAARWKALLDLLPTYKYDTDGALCEWAMKDYEENNNHRHLSHLYAAWPAYETQTRVELARGARIAIANRDRFNCDDGTAGHGWMHKALVQARLKNGDGMLASLLPMMREEGYYSSLMTDHDSNRRCNCYCTDTSFGTIAAVNEALVFSNTGEIEVLPALPSDWQSGSIEGLMARTGVEVKLLAWDLPNRTVQVVLHGLAKSQEIRLSAGMAWSQAKVNGRQANAQRDERGDYLGLQLDEGTEVVVDFVL